MIKSSHKILTTIHNLPNSVAIKTIHHAIKTSLETFKFLLMNLLEFLKYLVKQTIKYSRFNHIDVIVTSLIGCTCNSFDNDVELG